MYYDNLPQLPYCVFKSTFKLFERMAATEKIFLLFFACSLNIVTIFGDDSIVNTIYGPIQGNVSYSGRAFTSIPYASPPINELRWMPPLPPTNWTNIMETKSDPPGCIQYCALPNWACPTKISEDCLYLNVFTPPISNTSNHSGYPVMLFFHGGGYSQGYGGGWLYNGTNLAFTTDTIIVSANYRLGPLGWLYDDLYNIKGNQGYFDSLFALKWVKSNIAAFGGNPDQITIFGESAGSSTVSTMICDPTLFKSNLFQNAIMESGGANVDIKSIADWNTYSVAFYHNLGCDDSQSQKECIYNATSDDILRAQELTATIDGLSGEGITGNNVSANVIMNLLQCYQTGNYNPNVNIIHGVNKDEGWFFFDKPMNQTTYNGYIINGFGDAESKEIMTEYPCNDCSDIGYQDNAALIWTDFVMNCPTRNTSLNIAMEKNGNNNNNIWMYHFNAASKFTKDLFGFTRYHQCYDRACHSFELPYIWRPDFKYCQVCDDKTRNTSYTGGEMELIRVMQQYWTTFAKNGDPGNGGDKFLNVQWSKYNTDTQLVIVFDIDKVEIMDKYDIVHCQFWDQVGYN